MVLLSLALLAIGFFILYKSGDYTVKSSVGISESLNLGRFAIGFLFVALATNAPEIFVTISSMLKGYAGIAVGTAIGSSLSNITIILGLGVIIAGTIYLKHKDTVDLIEMLFVASLIPLFIIQSGAFTIIHGLVLLALFAFFVNKIRGEKIVTKEHRVDVPKFGKNLLVFGIAIAFLLLSAELIVRETINLTQMLPISPEFMGLTVIAIGTSLPELMVTITAIRKKEYSLATANIFGSSIINLTLLLGTISLMGLLLGDAVVNFEPVSVATPFLLLATLTTWYFLSRKNRIVRREAYILIALFILFLLNEIGLFVVFPK